MLKVGDTVKVVAKTKDVYNADTPTELIPIGSICKITDVSSIRKSINGKRRTIKCYELDGCYYYLEEELEKGSLEWVRDEEYYRAISPRQYITVVR